MNTSMEILNKVRIIIILEYGPSTKDNGTSSFVMNRTIFFQISFARDNPWCVKTLPKKKEMVDWVGLNLFFATCLSLSRPYFFHSFQTS